LAQGKEAGSAHSFCYARLEFIHFRIHFIYQTEPLPALHSSFEGCQHSFHPYARFDPSPSGLRLPCLRSPFRRSRRCFCFLSYVRHVSTSLRSLRSSRITRSLRYYGRSDSCMSAQKGEHMGSPVHFKVNEHFGEGSNAEFGVFRGSHTYLPMFLATENAMLVAFMIFFGATQSPIT